MGRGKGNPTSWIACVSRGQILFEMDGVNLSNAGQAAPCNIFQSLFDWLRWEKRFFTWRSRFLLSIMFKY
ncbi:hypothetical protein H5410_033549 [Solanum commersonii]|uniref:Ribosomal protein L10e/L16 domain-containing protein n=1 Tax=Solanum commersonii TaxID=4109 RepID=A0A9J5YN59_SOLCO|nr:hypothetical protein H5410_033549 [Solanum commersonii]